MRQDPTVQTLLTSRHNFGDSRITINIRPRRRTQQDQTSEYRTALQDPHVKEFQSRGEPFRITVVSVRARRKA